MSVPGKINVLYHTAGDARTFTNATGTATKFLDIAAPTNVPAIYYRVRLVP